MTAAHHFTVADLASFPNDGNRYEIIDGELYVSTAPHARHQITQDRVLFALLAWSEQPGRGIAISGAGLIFASDQAVIPDVLWVSSARLPVVFRGDGRLHAAPELVVEVLSPGADNEQRDRETKRKLYSRQGVQEYWIVDWVEQTVQVYRREQATLGLVLTLAATDRLTSPLLPGFSLAVGDLFPWLETPV